MLNFNDIIEILTVLDLKERGCGYYFIVCVDKDTWKDENFKEIVFAYEDGTEKLINLGYN